MRLYGRRFWPSLALGVGPAVGGVTLTQLPGYWQLAFAMVAGGFLATASYIGATVIAADAPLEPRRVGRALVAGTLVFLPVPFLANLLILPAVAWLGLAGLVVPVLMVEGTRVPAAFRRAFALARADPIHAVGGLATLAIVGLLTTWVLFFLLRGQAESTLAAAAALAVLVVSPLLFLGAALLYFDQAARAELESPGRRR